MGAASAAQSRGTARFRLQSRQVPSGNGQYTPGSYNPDPGNGQYVHDNSGAYVHMDVPYKHL